MVIVMKNISISAGTGRGTYQINWNRKSGRGYWYRYIYDPELGRSRSIREDPPGWDGPKGITVVPTEEEIRQIKHAIKLGNGAPKIPMDETVKEGIQAMFKLFNDLADLPQVGPEFAKWAEAHPSQVAVIKILEALMK